MRQRLWLLAVLLAIAPSLWGGSVQRLDPFSLPVVNVPSLRPLLLNAGTSGLRLEIGGGAAPICPSCLQIDKYVSIPNGVVADAKALPLDQGSVSFIVSKNFRWFGRRAVPEHIDPYLKEYHRVLRPGGSIVLLKELQLHPEAWVEHIRSSNSLGFEVLLTALQTPYSGGLILVKPVEKLASPLLRK